LTPASFSNGSGHPRPISIEELRRKKLEKVTFAGGLLSAYQLVDLKKAA
jgi:hypothetical protein